MRSAVSPPSDMPTTSRGVRRPLAQHRPQRLGVELGPVVAVLAPRRTAVAGQVDGQRGQAEAEDHGVPGVRVLAAAVQEHHLRWLVTPLERADRRRIRCARRSGSGPVAPICSAFSGSSANSSRLEQFVVGDLRHGSTLHTAKFTCARSVAVSASSCMALTSNAPTGLTIRTVEDADWSAMALLAATCFGVWRPQEATDMWRTLMPADGAVVACDGADVVGMALYLDLKLTVPGGAVLPMAGVSWVAVAPTHRRRGVLRADVRRTARPDGWTIRSPGLEASEAGIYGRFGYGPATVMRPADRRPDARHGFTPTFPIPVASDSSGPREHRRAARGDLRAMAAADPGRPVQPAPAVGRGARRPRGRAGTEAARSSVCCTPTVSRCTGCTAAGSRRSVEVTKFAAVDRRRRTSRCGGPCSAWTSSTP